MRTRLHLFAGILIVTALSCSHSNSTDMTESQATSGPTYSASDQIAIAREMAWLEYNSGSPPPCPRPCEEASIIVEIPHAAEGTGGTQNSTGGQAAQNAVGHSGIGIGNEFWDFGPGNYSFGPINTNLNTTITGVSSPGTWWWGNRFRQRCDPNGLNCVPLYPNASATQPPTFSEVLAAMPYMIGNYTTLRIPVCLNPTGAALLRSYWNALTTQAPSWGVPGNHCTTTVAQSLGGSPSLLAAMAAGTLTPSMLAKSLLKAPQTSDFPAAVYRCGNLGPLKASTITQWNPGGNLQINRLTVTSSGLGEVWPFAPDSVRYPFGAIPSGASIPFASFERPQFVARSSSNTSTFLGWSGACSGTGNCSVTLSQNQNINAQFGSPPCANPGWVQCGGICQDLLTSRLNCGRCGNTCAASETCTAGVCMPTTNVCPVQTQRLCNGVCVDTMADRNNCGACGITCIPGYLCNAGVCRSPT